MSASGQVWYRDGLRFRCTVRRLLHRRPGFVWVNKAEIETLAAALRLEIAEFERRCVRTVGVRKSLVELANGDCIFFHGESRSCGVYKERPRQCRTWPFWCLNLATPAAWERMCETCPGGNRGPLFPLEKIQARLGVMDI